MELRTIICFVALLTSLTCVSGLHAKRPPKNLLLDPGFEEVEKPEHLIAGTNGPWQVRGAEEAKGELATPTIDKEDFVEGVQSIHILNIKGGWTDMQQGWWTGSNQFLLEEDQKYTLSAWMKTSVPGAVNIKLSSWKDPWPNWGSKRVTLTTKWAEYFLTCTVREETLEPWCEFRFESLKDVWFDSAWLYEDEYVPSPGPQAVKSQDKLAATWGEVKGL